MSFTATRPSVYDVHTDVKARRQTAAAPRCLSYAQQAPPAGYATSDPACLNARLTHLQFEAMLTRRETVDQPVPLRTYVRVWLRGLRIAVAVGADIDNLGEEHGQWVLPSPRQEREGRLGPLLPAVSRAVDRAAEDARRTAPAEQAGCRWTDTCSGTPW